MLEKDVYGKRNAPFVFFDDALQHFNFALVQRRKKTFPTPLGFSNSFQNRSAKDSNTTAPDCFLCAVFVYPDSE